jgi:hypothetical protein
MRREGLIKLTGKLKRCVVRWKPAAGRIISAAFFELRVTTFG